MDYALASAPMTGNQTPSRRHRRTERPTAAQDTDGTDMMEAITERLDSIVSGHGSMCSRGIAQDKAASMLLCKLEQIAQCSFWAASTSETAKTFCHHSVKYLLTSLNYGGFPLLICNSPPDVRLLSKHRESLVTSKSRFQSQTATPEIQKTIRKETGLNMAVSSRCRRIREPEASSVFGQISEASAKTLHDNRASNDRDEIYYSNEASDAATGEAATAWNANNDDAAIAAAALLSISPSVLPAPLRERFMETPKRVRAEAAKRGMESLESFGLPLRPTTFRPKSNFGEWKR
eukprot:6199160-Pleurochrysis_carterae.AAC.1